MKDLLSFFSLSKTAVFVVFILFASCNKKVCLQRYFVEKSKVDGFTEVNVKSLPSVGLFKEYFHSINSDEVIDKVENINIPMFNNRNKDLFYGELNEITNILNQNKYASLMEFKYGTITSKFYCGWYFC